MRKLTSIVLIIFIFQFSTNAQQKADSVKTALMIVDIQDFYFSKDGLELVNPVPASLKAKEILQIFRDKKQLVIHIRHKGDKRTMIHKNVEPISTEKVITKEQINSFKNTGLLEYLRSNNINRLIIIGMQTQMCVEAATRAGHDFGFECYVIQDACATRDVKFGDRIVKAADVQTSVLAAITDGGYAKVIDLDIFKANVDKYLFEKLN